jgi:hypothetical protein
MTVKPEHHDWKQPIATQPLPLQGRATPGRYFSIQPLQAAMPYNNKRSTGCATSQRRVRFQCILKVDVESYSVPVDWVDSQLIKPESFTGKAVTPLPA